MNYLAIALATIAQFIIGSLWYTGLFGKTWGQIHGFDKLTKEMQKEMMSKMGPFYGLQLIVTIFSAAVLDKLMVLVPDMSVYTLAFLVWLGFVFPTQYSAVIFGGTESPWMIKKLAIMTFGSLACLLVGAAVLAAF